MRNYVLIFSLISKNWLHESHLSLSLLRGGWGRAGWAPPDAGSKNQWMNEKLCTNLVTNFKTCFTNHMSMGGGRRSGGVMIEAAVIKTQ